MLFHKESTKHALKAHSLRQGSQYSTERIQASSSPVGQHQVIELCFESLIFARKPHLFLERRKTRQKTSPRQELMEMEPYQVKLRIPKERPLVPSSSPNYKEKTA